MTLHHGDCLDVMAGMEPESVDAIVTDPPYGLEFMGKEWDRFAPGKPRMTATEAADHMTDGSYGPWGRRKRPVAPNDYGRRNERCVNCGKWRVSSNPCNCDKPEWVVRGREGAAPSMLALQAFSLEWARAALRVAKPSAYLLAFGGTRTVHRMTVALEDAGWIIRDLLVWGYASGFPKSKASLKPAWEPIVMARKPGPLRMLAIDECRMPIATDEPNVRTTPTMGPPGMFGVSGHNGQNLVGRWPANVILTDPIFDGGIEGVVGGGEAVTHPGTMRNDAAGNNWFGPDRTSGTVLSNGDSGTYSRFFLIPKADRADREPVLGGDGGRVVSVWGGDEDDLTPGKKSTIARRNHHPTVKPVDLMRHLVRLVTPSGGIVLDPFLGSGTTAIAAEMEGFDWIGIEKEAEYVAIAEARLNGTQRGLGLGA